MTVMEATTLVMTITGGGIISGIVALRKDRRDKKDGLLSLTQQAQEIAERAVLTVQKELNDLRNNTNKKIGELEGRVEDLEISLKAKERTIGMLVVYINQLISMVRNVEPNITLPVVPDEIKRYINIVKANKQQ